MVERVLPDHRAALPFVQYHTEKVVINAPSRHQPLQLSSPRHLERRGLLRGPALPKVNCVLLPEHPAALLTVNRTEDAPDLDCFFGEQHYCVLFAYHIKTNRVEQLSLGCLYLLCMIFDNFVYQFI